jgi:hypothetical protein
MRHDKEGDFCQVCPNKITTVDAISGELKFQKINSISVLDEKYLCVSDQVLDNVYKYDLNRNRTYRPNIKIGDISYDKRDATDMRLQIKVADN